MVPSEYGKLSLINSAISILFVFLSFNSQNAFSNRFMRDHSDFGSYLFSNLLFLIPFQITVLVLSPFFLEYLSPWFGITANDLFWILVICSLLSLFYIYTSYLQSARLSKEFSALNVIGKVSEIVLIFVFAILLIDNQYLSKIYAQLIVVVFSLLIVIPRLFDLIEVKFNAKYVKDAVFFAVPLIPHVLANSLLSQADRFLINSNMGAAAAGIYSFSYNLGMAIVVVIMAWNSSWQPKLYESIKEGKSSAIRNVSVNVSIVIIYFSVLLIMFSQEIVQVFSSSEYYSSIDIIPIIVIGNALIYVYIVYANFAFYAKKSLYISIATAFALIVNICLNLLLIPAFGIKGAAWATVLAYAILCLCHFYSSTYIIKLNVVSFRFFVFFLLSLLAFYFTYDIICQQMPYAQLLLFKIAIALGGAGYLFKIKARFKIA